jgi:hypothetical protein
MHILTSLFILLKAPDLVFYGRQRHIDHLTHVHSVEPVLERAPLQNPSLPVTKTKPGPKVVRSVFIPFINTKYKVIIGRNLRRRLPQPPRPSPKLLPSRRPLDVACQNLDNFDFTLRHYSFVSFR